MKESLASLRRPVHTLPEVVEVKELPDGSIQVTPINEKTIGARLRNPRILFLELRRKIRELTGDDSWTVRYASQVHDPMLPFLHSSGKLKVLIDPMSPYRNPIEALSKDGVLVLIQLNSHVYYFKPKDEALHESSSVHRKS